MHEREGGGIGIDTIRCRYNAFVETDHELPIFAPTDEIKPAVAGSLGDFNWVDLGTLGPHKSPATVLPYTGPRFYCKKTVGLLLDAGIARWDHVKLSFSAAVHRPASFMAQPLKLMDEIWTAVGESLLGHAYMEGRSARGLAKQASVGLFGIWACNDHYLYTMTTTSCADSAPAGPAAVSCTPPH